MLKYGRGVPTWVKRVSNRCHRMMGLDNWTVKVDMSAPDNFPEDQVAFNEVNGVYRQSHITLIQGLLQNEDGKGVIWHEFDHIRLSALSRVVDEIFEQRLKPDQALARWRDAEEAYVEGDVLFMARLRGGKL